MQSWIEKEKDRKYHPVAALFPLLDGAEFEELKADIAENGLLEPIWIDAEGKIIDGRNRHRACIETGRVPTFRVLNDGRSLVSFVVSMNLHRRHLSSSQRAVIALDVLPMLEEQAEERQKRLAGDNWQNRIVTQSTENLREQIPQGLGKATEQAATLLSTNDKYVKDAKALQEQAPDLLEQVKVGEKSIPQAKRELVERQETKEPEETKQKLRVHFSSETPEHYTPQRIIKAAIACMGGIDLDPCSNSKEAPNVPAERHYTKEDDGLAQAWEGRIYMNPPYGREIGDWVEKLCKEHEEGRTIQAIALVPARTDTQWWARMRDYCVCFVEGRLTFVGNDDPAPFPSAVFYFGEHLGAFYRAFRDIGDIWQRIEPGISFGE